MSEHEQIQAASRLFTRTIRELRASPERFAAGLALVDEQFSTKTIRAKAQAEMADIDARFMAGRPIPPFVVEAYRQEVDSASEPMSKVGALRTFVETRKIGLDRAEAQAVLLVVAWVADDDPDYSIGLPALLESWISEHWKKRRQPDRAERIASNRELLRFLRHGLKHDEEWRQRLAHVCQLAWDRMDAAAPVVVDHAPLSEAGEAVYTILCALPDTKGRTAKELVQDLADLEPPINVDEQRIKGHVRNELESRGIQRSGHGYYIPMSRRPTREA